MELNDPNLTRILVVDDDEIVRTRIKEELQPQGFTVTAVEGAQQALEHLRTERFSVVLSDFEMPGMNGLAATAAIRALEAEGERLPIIALTGCTGLDERKRCLASGMDDYTAKPLAVATAANMLRAHVRSLS